MSLLGKKPFIQEMLGKLSESELSLLASLVNSSDNSDPAEYFLVGSRNVLSEQDKGVQYVKIKLGDYFHVGYLCYASNGDCGFFSFQNGASEVTEYSIDVASHSFKVIQEHLSAGEFRSEIDDAIGGNSSGGGVTVQQLHEKIEGDEFITADVNEAGTKIKISLDTDYRPHVVELVGSGGKLSDDDYMKLCGPTSSYTAIVLLDGEFYQVGDEQESFDTYVHVGRDNGSQVNIKTIYIYTEESSVNYKNWVLSSITVAPITDDGLKIGSTTLSEEQLKKLLALIA